MTTSIGDVLNGRTVKAAWVSPSGTLIVELDGGELLGYVDPIHWSYTTQPSERPGEGVSQGRRRAGDS